MKTAWVVHKLEPEGGQYRTTFFWVVPTQKEAFAQAQQVLDADDTGNVAINIAPMLAMEVQHATRH